MASKASILARMMGVGNTTIANPAISSPTISNATLTSPTISSPTISNATLTSPTISNATLSAPVLGTPASGNLSNCTGVQYTGFKNRIINGGMVLDQRNAGATSTANGVYTVDRWNFGAGVAGKMTYGQNRGSLTTPAGFRNYFGFITTTAYTVGAGEFFLFTQEIEGFNVADFDLGKATAQTFTLSFWVNSTLTGTFGGVLSNSAQNRSFPFTYTINAASTWEQKTVTVVGDTTGTWLTTNGKGLSLMFGLGVGSTFNGTSTGAWQAATYLGATGATSVVGTLNATWNITGVQLEKSSTATSFDYRPYGTELQLCQRYYERWAEYYYGNGYAYNSTQGEGTLRYAVQKRAAPSVSGSGTFYFMFSGTTYTFTAPVFDNTSINNTLIYKSGMSALPSGQAGRIANSSSSYIEFSAEL